MAADTRDASCARAAEWCLSASFFTMVTTSARARSNLVQGADEGEADNQSMKHEMHHEAIMDAEL